MSKVLDKLSQSQDPVDQEILKTLRVLQNIKSSKNNSKSIGYEPRDIERFGAIEVIERRIRNMASGFDLVPAKDSYEAIVLKYPSRFNPEVVAIAAERIGQEEEAFSPTADSRQLEEKVSKLLERTYLPYPKGNINPSMYSISSNVFLRDPWVKAYVLRRANGRCEACATPAPFKTTHGLDFLECHHMKPLAQGGSDRAQNAVAVCPNCHRALHHAHNAKELANQVYKRVSQLVVE